MTDLGTADFEILYTSGAEQVRVNFVKDDETPTLEWSDFYRDAIDKIEIARRNQELLLALAHSDREAIHRARLTMHREYGEMATRVLGPWSKFEPIFIPAGRAFFSQFSRSVFTRLESGETLDPFWVAFGSTLERITSVFEETGFFSQREESPQEQIDLFAEIRPIFRSILNARLIRADNQIYLQFDDGRQVNIAQASSGHQEAIPLLLLLSFYCAFPRGSGCAVYIEEPEAHLFPTTQRQMVELMAKTFRARQNQMSLVIETHSPYILTSINNLLQAGKLYADATPEEANRLRQLVKESLILKPNEVSFYALADGTARSILDPETELIDASMIDQVSDDIAIQFDDLLATENEKS